MFSLLLWYYLYTVSILYNIIRAYHNLQTSRGRKVRGWLGHSGFFLVYIPSMFYVNLRSRPQSCAWISCFFSEMQKVQSLLNAFSTTYITNDAIKPGSGMIADFRSRRWGIRSRIDIFLQPDATAACSIESWKGLEAVSPSSSSH